MKSITRQNILNFVEASKFLTTIPELNSRYHLSFQQIGERPKHYSTQQLARFDGETVTKRELLSALSEIEDDVDISIATHGDYEWGYSISMATDVETPYSDEDWLAEILKNYLYFGLNVRVDTMLMMRDNTVKSCADYESLITLVRALYDFKFDIENNINLDEVISVRQIITFKLLARLFEEMLRNSGDYLSKDREDSNFYSNIIDESDEDYIPIIIADWVDKNYTN